MVQFYLIAAITLIVLKTCGVVLLSWWIVLAPFYMPIALFVSFVLFIVYNLDKEQAEELQAILEDDNTDTSLKVTQINTYFKLAVTNFTNKINIFKGN